MKHSILFFSLLIFSNLTVLAQSAEDYHKKASDYYDKEDYENAILNINQALQTDPGNAIYLLFKGNAFEKGKKIQEAYDTYTLAISLNPRDSRFYSQRGVLLTNVLNIEYAIRDFNAALDFETVDSLKTVLLHNRGAAKIYTRDFQGAYDDFIAALQYDTLNIGILNNLATVCDEVGKGEQTLTYLHKILKIDSTFIGAHLNIGFKYQEMGEYLTAIKYFNKVLELEPEEPLAFSNRAYCRYKTGDYDNALSDINVSIRLFPANSYAYRNRALIYLAKNKVSEACADIEESLRFGFTKVYGDEVENLKKQHCK
jgi:tetratricopeptide (TPR) repeat protein